MGNQSFPGPVSRSNVRRGGVAREGNSVARTIQARFSDGVRKPKVLEGPEMSESQLHRENCI